MKIKILTHIIRLSDGHVMPDWIDVKMGEDPKDIKERSEATEEATQATEENTEAIKEQGEVAEQAASKLDKLIYWWGYNECRKQIVRNWVCCSSPFADRARPV